MASCEKERIEKSQRQRRKDNESNGSGDLIGDIAVNDNEVSSPSTSIATDDSEGRARWFDMKEDQISGRKEWIYRGGYFEAKWAAANGSDWPDHDIPDILKIQYRFCPGQILG